jgi:hypothetical protein
MLLITLSPTANIFASSGTREGVFTGPADVSRWLLYGGQQRLYAKLNTTCSLKQTVGLFERLPVRSGMWTNRTARQSASALPRSSRSAYWLQTLLQYAEGVVQRLQTREHQTNETPQVVHSCLSAVTGFRPADRPTWKA